MTVCKHCGQAGCYSMCKIGIRERNKLWASKNKETVAAKGKRWRENNTSNKVAQTRARRNKITVGSFKHEVGRMNAFYKYAATLRRDLPELNYVVDHIVPIIHPNVCGLHVIANLQLIPYAANGAKGNRFDV